MKGLIKAGLALGAVTAGTLWAIHKLAPEKLEDLKHKLKNARGLHFTVRGKEDMPASGNEEPQPEAEEAGEEWPDLSTIPGEDAP